MAIICVALLAIKRKGVMPYVRQVLIVLILFAINLRPMYISSEIKVIRQKLNCYCIIVLDDTLSMMAEDVEGGLDEDAPRTRMDRAKEDIEHIQKTMVGAKFCIIDFNNDGVAHITDLYLAMSMITGEHVDGKTYDVTVDMNKDGVVDLEDLSIAYNYAVGNYTEDDLFKMGISDAELEILGFGATKTCNNSACNTVLPEGAVYCHVCGNHQ